MTPLSPILVFAFNRPDSIRRTIEALARNPEAPLSNLFVFVDGPRPHIQEDNEKVQAVRDYVGTIQGFRSVTCELAETNRGLAQSIIGGTTKIIEQYGRVIVVEDDLYVSHSFLRYMNEMLCRFEHDSRIMQVSGYGPRLHTPCKSDIYLNGRAQSWTWGTWRDRWETVDWQVKDFHQLQSSHIQQMRFRCYGSDLYGMLCDYMLHRNNSWFIRFMYAMYRQGRYCITPVRSLVRNEGFDGQGTHCNNYNRYKIDFEEEHIGGFRIPQEIKPSRLLMRDAVFYWSIPMRIYGRIRTILDNKTL